MAKILSDSTTFIPGGSKVIHVGSGYLIWLLISHAETDPQVVTLYDNHTAEELILVRMYIAPQVVPVMISFESRIGLRFTRGLSVDAGNCLVSLAASGGQVP